MNVVGVTTLNAFDSDRDLQSTLSDINFVSSKPTDVGSSGGGDHEGGQTLFKSTAAPGSYLCADQNGIKVSDVDCGNSTALKFGSYRGVGTLCLGQDWINTGCREFGWSDDSSCHGGARYSYGIVSQDVTGTCSLSIDRNVMDMKIEFDGSVFTLQEIQVN